MMPASHGLARSRARSTAPWAYRARLDPLRGLLPGLGDLAGAALSGDIVLTGLRLGVPRTVALRMTANVALDTVVGSVPVIGDLFDAGWKANNRNVALIERHVAAPDATRTASRLMIGAVVVALALLAFAGVALTVLSVRWLFSHSLSS